MAFYANGHITSSSFYETLPINKMRIKSLSDGSVWGRIHWLNVVKDATYFTDTEVADCDNQKNRFSKMGIVDRLATSQVKLVNLAPTIDGVTGFARGAAKTAEGYQKYTTASLELTGTTSSAEITSQTSTACVPLIQGHTYYVCVEAKQPAVVGGGQIYLGGTTAGSITEPSFFSAKKVSAAATWTKLSAVNTRTFPTGNHKLRLDFDNSKVAGTMCFTGLMVIDLTACFGAGEEPNQAWCDANIPYFEGEKIINAESSGYKKWEFMLTYPSISNTLYNRWSQTSSPNEATVTNLIKITSAWSAHFGGIRKHGSAAVYDCDTGDTWYAPIGQKSKWTDTQAIPSADGTAQTETELWVRIDNLNPAIKAQIYKQGFVSNSFYEL